MKTFIIGFVVFLIAVTGMAVGVLIGGAKRCIKGSCGGIASLPGMEGGCSACGRGNETPPPGDQDDPPGQDSPARKGHLLGFLPAALLLFVTPFSDAPAEEGPKVVASILPIHSLVSGVMEGVGKPSLIVPGYASPHTYRLRPSDAAALHGADLVFHVGDTLETFLRKPLSSLPDTVQVVSLMETDGLVLLRNRKGGAWEHGHSTSAHDHDHGEKGSFPGYNPHIWLDLENARRILEAIARHLSEKFPLHAARYQANVDGLSERLDALADRLQKRFSGLGGIPYLVFHDAYPYLEARYGLWAAGSVTAHPDSLPSARRIAEIRSTVERLGIRCVFREPQFEGKLLETALGDMGVTIGVLDPLGVAMEPGPDLWFRIMDTHAQVMAGCLSQGK